MPDCKSFSGLCYFIRERISGLRELWVKSLLTGGALGSSQYIGIVAIYSATNWSNVCVQLTSRMYCVSQVLKKKVMKTLEPVRDSVFIFKSTINMDAFLFCFSHPPFFSLSITSWIFCPHLLSILTSSSSFSSHPPLLSSPPTLQSPHLPLVLASSSAAPPPPPPR